MEKMNIKNVKTDFFYKARYQILNGPKNQHDKKDRQNKSHYKNEIPNNKYEQRIYFLVYA